MHVHAIVLLLHELATVTATELAITGYTEDAIAAGSNAVAMDAFATAATPSPQEMAQRPPVTATRTSESAQYPLIENMTSGTPNFTLIGIFRGFRDATRRG